VIGESNDEPPVSKGLADRIFHWFDERTGAKELMHKVLHEPIPGGAKLAYVFGSGLLFIFLLQCVTGVSLALYYTPTAQTAHTSVAYITKQVAGGAFLRSLHSYGSSAMIIVLALHFLQTFLYGSFKGRRELLWLSGAVLSFLVLGMGFTGYLLPWDQKAYFATAVGTNVAGQAPIIGDLLTRLMRGGDTIGTLTLSRFYVAHVFLIPATIFLFVGAHIFLFRKAGPAGPVKEDPIHPKLAPEPFYPRQVLFDMGFVLLIMATLAGLAYFHPATLGPIANPADTHFLPRPEWYYLPLFEWLKFWEGPKVVVGIVVIPGLLAMAFFLMPFLDRKLERRPWRRPIPALAVAIVVFGMVFLSVKSQLDDKQSSVAEQLALQAEQERAYSAAPFQPYVEPKDEVVPAALPVGPVSPLVGAGRRVFSERGCSGCHGPMGKGTTIAPSLVGVVGKFGQEQLEALLRNPNPRMRVGRMPAVDAPTKEMATLIAYLGVLGTAAASAPEERPAILSRARFNADTHPVAAKKADLVATVPADSGSGNPVTPVAQAAPLDTGSGKSIESVASGQKLFLKRGCFTCHGRAGAGGLAPALPPLVSQLSDSKLKSVLERPTEKMKAGGMPPVQLTSEDMEMLLSYLRSLCTPRPENQPTAQDVAPQ